MGFPKEASIPFADLTWAGVNTPAAKGYIY